MNINKPLLKDWFKFFFFEISLIIEYYKFKQLSITHKFDYKMRSTNKKLDFFFFFSFPFHKRYGNDLGQYVVVYTRSIQCPIPTITFWICRRLHFHAKTCFIYAWTIEESRREWISHWKVDMKLNNLRTWLRNLEWLKQSNGWKMFWKIILLVTDRKSVV